MISTKGRYALRVMLDLADPSRRASGTKECFTPLEEIANRQGISKKYLEIILKVLVRHKLLKGLRGKGGGYRLTRAPEEYTVGEILTLTEGGLAIVACLSDDDPPCMKRGECLTLPMWKKFDQMTHDFFFGITLADLINGGFRHDK